MRAPFLLPLLVSTALAQAPPIRHEPLPAARAHAARTDRVIAGQGPLATAIQTSAGTIAAPQQSKPGDDTPLYKPQTPPRVGMDRRTGADGQLHYKVVFDPSIAPFKRELAFDTVKPDVTLGLGGRGLRELQPGGQARQGHELFWGHVRLQLQPGQRAVLPSVAPTSQILQWQAVPALPLKFWRDDAGNYTVGAEVPADLDLRFLMDAPSTYFAAPLGVQVRKDDPPVVAMDVALQHRAEALWGPIGVSRHMERSAALSKLVEWFRSFTPGQPPEQGVDPMADLVLGQKGVCRHRALGFQIMATSLGIPSHYVMNDAHAFIEVWAPGTDGRGAWQRIDLGGGAESLELHAAKDKRLHQPQWRDPFPRPQAYTSELDDVKTDESSAGGGRAWAGAKNVKGADFAASQPGAEAPTGPATAGQKPGPPPSVAETRRQWLAERAQRLAAPMEPPMPGRPPPQDARLPTRTTLQAASPMAWVGEPLRVTGVLTAAAHVERKPIELWLIDPRKPMDGKLLSVAVTDAQGRFALDLAIPADTDLQVYDLVARFGGDTHLRPSDSSP